MVNFRAGARKHRMSLGHLVVPESKEVLGKNKMIGPFVSKEHMSHPERAHSVLS